VGHKEPACLANCPWKTLGFKETCNEAETRNLLELPNNERFFGGEKLEGTGMNLPPKVRGVELSRG
jgi:hypothetical protein